MKPYELHSPCAACGATNAFSEYQKPQGRPNTTDKPRVRRVCDRCQYVWYERPLFDRAVMDKGREVDVSTWAEVPGTTMLDTRTGEIRKNKTEEEMEEEEEVGCPTPTPGGEGEEEEVNHNEEEGEET